jgi:hypothetical protein
MSERIPAPAPDKNDVTPRQRWMLYAVYAAAAWVVLGAAVLFLTLNETRKFIGEKGVEYCWMYGSFQRYLYINLASLCVDIVTLFGLYWLARGNYLIVYLIIWAVWLFGEPLLSFFDMSYC